jgi:hypothetical protein
MMQTHVVHLMTLWSTQDYIQRRMTGWWRIINWEACGRKRSWPTLSNYPGTCLERLKQITRKPSFRKFRIPVSNRTGHGDRQSQCDFDFDRRPDYDRTRSDWAVHQRAFENQAELRREEFGIQKELSVTVLVTSNKPNHQI